MIYDKPIIFNDFADVKALNELFDQVTRKPFLSPMVAINTIRAALDLFGITLPKLDVETQIEGPNTMDALQILMSGKRLETPPLDCEYLFKIVDNNEKEDKEHGVGDDWDNHLYLYIVLDRLEHDGVYEAYAQVVDEEEVSDLLDQDIPAEIAALDPEWSGDVNGEDNYLKTIRHSGTGGFTGEV